VASNRRSIAADLSKSTLAIFRFAFYEFFVFAILRFRDFRLRFFAISEFLDFAFRDFAFLTWFGAKFKGTF
jgi:hypothetical protein